jgi:acetolactate synthase-1/2/3 large subunit
MPTVAENVIRFLEEQSVAHCFGLPGAQTLELYDAILDSNIRSVLTTNEPSAVFMADGYARASGKVGVCLTIAGPGLTNMATGLAEALVDSSPVVALVAGVPDDSKHFHIHEVDQLAALKPLVKAVFRPASVSGLGHTLGDAFRLAQSEEPGPVVVEIPTDWFRSNTDFESYRSKPQESPVASTEITRIADIVLGAKQCGLYLGRGALGAASQFRLIAEKLCAPVATTVSGKGVLPEDHPLAVGYGYGPAGSDLSQEVFRKCDVVLAVGCKFSELATSKWEMKPPAKFIHVDRNPAVLNVNYPASISLCADARDFADELLHYFTSLTPRKNTELLELIGTRKAERAVSLSDGNGSGRINPARLLYRLRNALERSAILVTDCGNNQLWAVSDYPVLEPGTFLTPADYQSMGFGIPAAIGAALARPHQRVVCLCGDAGFLMTCMELLTAVRERLNLKVIVFNDGALGLIKNLQKSYGRESSVALHPLDYQSFAEAVGAKYVELPTENDLDGRLSEAINTDGVVLVNAKVTYDDWSPMLKGTVLAAWNRLPLPEKLSMVGRRAVRAVRYFR